MMMIQILLMTVAPSAFAASVADKCPDIAACAKAVSEVSGQKFVFSDDVKAKVHATPNLELTAENAELLFTTMLHEEGFTRVPLPEKNTYQIVRQRDARDSAIPLIEASKKTAPELPNNWDMMTLRYKAEFADSVDHIAWNARSFMPASARIIPDEVSGIVLITDSAMNLKKLYAIIKDMDVKVSPEIKKRWDEQRRQNHLERMARPPKGKGPPPKDGE